MAKREDDFDVNITDKSSKSSSSHPIKVLDIHYTPEKKQELHDSTNLHSFRQATLGLDRSKKRPVLKYKAIPIPDIASNNLQGKRGKIQTKLLIRDLFPLVPQKKES